MATVEEILTELYRSREGLLEAIESLPDEALTQAGAFGGLSISDLLEQQIAWEAELVTGLMRLDQGKKPGRLLAALRQPAEYDKQRLDENKERDLDDVFDDFQQVRMHLETWIEELSERNLNDPRRYKWLRGKPLAQVIAEVTHERESKVAADLERFAKKWHSDQR